MLTIAYIFIIGFLLALFIYLITKSKKSQYIQAFSLSSPQTVSFDLSSGDFGDFYFNFPFKNSSLSVLLDTGSSSVVVNSSQYNHTGLKTVSGYPMNPIVYLGISATPQEWYQDEFQWNNSEKSITFPVASALASSDQFPNIFGLAETYTPVYGGANYKSFTDWTYITNFVIDLNVNKFIINEKKNEWKYKLPREKQQIKCFKTSFFAACMQLDDGTDVLVVFDTGMGNSLCHNVGFDSGMNAQINLSFKGQKLFNISAVPIPGDSVASQWADIRLVIMGNPSMTNYRFGFTSDEILIQPVAVNLRTTPHPRVSKNVVLKRFEEKYI